MATFTITVQALFTADQDSFTNVVKHADFTLTATESGQSIVYPSSADMGNVDVDNFIPFNDLTETDVANWINALLLTDNIKTQAQTALDHMVWESGLTPQPLPWA